VSKGGRLRSTHKAAERAKPESWGPTLAYAAMAFAVIIVVALFVRNPPAWFSGPPRQLTAVLSYQLIAHATTIPVTLSGTDLRLTNHTLRIDYLCTAVDLMIIYLLAVLFVPVSWRSKSRALLWGPPIIFVVNLARIVALAAVSQWAPAYFSAIHTYTFEAFMVLTVAGSWAVWLYTCRDEWLGVPQK
jgi:exosortase/archaeosortase family protein